MRGKSPKRMIWWMVYALLASKLPSWLRLGKRFRVLCASRFCDYVDPTANINRLARVGWQAQIGPHAGVGERCTLSGRVTLHSHVTMGPDCMFITGDHPTPPDFGYFRDMSPSHAPIVVEEDAFIGARVIVLGGVTIGKGAVVGAGSVVAKDVARGATVVGNPAKEIRRRLVSE